MAIRKPTPAPITGPPSGAISILISAPTNTHTSMSKRRLAGLFNQRDLTRWSDLSRLFNVRFGSSITFPSMCVEDFFDGNYYFFKNLLTRLILTEKPPIRNNLIFNSGSPKLSSKAILTKVSVFTKKGLIRSAPSNSWSPAL